jgi:hypothetical protein
LSAWQIAYGSELMVHADSEGELSLKITAEVIKGNLIDLAARLVDAIGEAATATKGRG